MTTLATTSSSLPDTDLVYVSDAPSWTDLFSRHIGLVYFDLISFLETDVVQAGSQYSRCNNVTHGQLYNIGIVLNLLRTRACRRKMYSVVPYNGVRFLKKGPHNRQPIARPCFCELEWCLSHCSTVCNITICGTRLYLHLYHLSQWNSTGCRHSSARKSRTYLVYIFNITAANALGTQSSDNGLTLVRR